MNVAIQGDKGAFSEIVASKFLKEAVFIPCKTFKEVFDVVKSGSAKLGIIPVENSLTGRIKESTEVLISSGLNICGEVMLTVIHCLIAKEECSPEDLKQIYAHPEALMQCKRFLSKLNAELISWYDGAAAARIVKRKKHSGLIAGEKVAEIYGLKILLKGIQDSKNNITRFFIISKNPSKPTGDDKTSVVFSTRHKPGALYHALESFAKENINLTRLESMPSKEKPWEYLFLMDFEGHRDDSRVKKALEELKKHVTQVKILGSYPRDKNIFIEGKVR